MTRIVQDIKTLLLSEGSEITDQDAHELWDEDLGSVPGGINWATDYAGSLDGSSFVGVTGPDLGEPKVDF
ncbi:hypothetical protein ABZ807_14805 [Micromonospora sp. NPDC047548]|uniref:hypothetical protein n=1 Tax=Micromonospora sp. NPDC047548 TaxID=3155624 RepID=UPI0033FF598D